MSRLSRRCFGGESSGWWMGSGAFAGEADGNEDGHGEGDHEEGDGDALFKFAHGPSEPNGGGQDFGFHAGGAGEDEDGAELAEATRPGDGGGGEHAAAGGGEGDVPDSLGTGAAEGHGNVFGTGGKVIKDAAHGADGECGGDDKLSECDTGDGVGEGDEFFDALAHWGLEKDQQAKTDDHRREDDGDIKCGINKGAADEAGAGHEVADGDGDE